MSRILLADDSGQALRLAEQILAGAGFEVVSVTDGATALRRLSDVDPDVLLCDVYLPSKNGFELARYVKSEPRHKHVGVIFAASLSDQFDEQDARNAGAAAILRKPFEASSLLAAVGELLSKGAAEKAAGSGAAILGIDRATIRAAVTLALDSAMPAMIDELTEHVVGALLRRA